MLFWWFHLLRRQPFSLGVEFVHLSSHAKPMSRIVRASLCLVPRRIEPHAPIQDSRVRPKRSYAIASFLVRPVCGTCVLGGRVRFRRRVLWHVSRLHSLLPLCLLSGCARRRVGSLVDMFFLL